MLLLTLVACGDISNEFLEEDAEFLAALPTEERQTIALEGDGVAKGLGDAPSLLQRSYEVSSNVNATIFLVLGAMDRVRALPPTSRTEDSRTWGPFDWEDRVDLQADIVRTGVSRFDWSMTAISGFSEIPFITGTHYAGDTVAAGDGQFTWEIDEVSALLGETSAGTLVVDYDNREGVDLLVDIDGVTDGSAAPTAALYAYRLVDDGDFQYQTELDVDGDGVTEQVQVRTRWQLDQAGRSDAVLNGGSLGELEMRWTQCWDDSLGLTYEEDNLGVFPTVGSDSDCPYADFAEVDRLSPG